MAQDFKQIDSTIDVVTPENISFEYQVAGPFRRLPAFIIDLTIRFGVGLGLLFLATLTGAFAGGPEFAIAAWLLFWFVMEWFYGGLLETYWNGQTFGKRVMGIRVLRIDGQPINGLQAVMRNILRVVDLMPMIPIGTWIEVQGPWPIPTCLIGLVAPILNRRFQRLGDLVCGTMVVVEERSWLLGTARLDDPRTKHLAAQLPSTFKVSRRLGQAVAAYVERRRYLSAARRHEIAQHLGRILVPHFGLDPDTSYDLLLCALYYRTFVSDEFDEEALPSGLLGQGISFRDESVDTTAVSPRSP